MLNIGIVGCGAIGSCLIKVIKENFKGKAKVTAVCDLDRKKAENAITSFRIKPKVLSLQSLIKASDLIIEAASASISAMVARKALMAGKEVMIMSTGGLLNRDDIFHLANKKKRHLYIPSGAVCGLDGIKSASAGKIQSVALITKKPPEGLEGAPYLVKNNINLNLIKKETVVFSGSAEEAIMGFPKNINVSSVLSLASLGAKKTKVEIICLPKADVNSHTILAKGDFGELMTQTKNLPSPDNPKTSYLAVLSAAAMLKSILDYVKIGN